MTQEKQPFLRLRSNGNGLHVFYGKTWVPVDERVAENIRVILDGAFPRQCEVQS